MASTTESIDSKVMIRILPVVCVEDSFSETAGDNTLAINSFGRRIKVRFLEDGPNLVDEHLPWCFPLLPKHLQIMPKKGEMVMVFSQELDGIKGNRFYVGPIISQDYFLNHGGRYNAMSLLKGTGTKPLVHPVGDPSNDGTYPDQNTVALQSRGDSALWLQEEEVRLLCGHKPYWRRSPNNTNADPGCLEFNKKDLSYIQMRYDNFNQSDGKQFRSVVNVVADRIHLVTHNGADSESYLTVTDQSELMTKDSVERFASQGQRMVYGDELIDFLKKFRTIFLEHTHKWSMDRQVFSAKDAEFWSKNLDELLCDTIRLA